MADGVPSMFPIPSYQQLESARRELLFIIASISVIWGAITGLIGSKCAGNSFLWFILGALLGPFALPLPLFFAGTTCPKCRGRIHRQASICLHCRSTVTVCTSSVTESLQRMVGH